MDEGLRGLLAGASLALLFVFSLADAALRLFARSRLEEKISDPRARERLRRRLEHLPPLKVTARSLRILCLIVFVAAIATSDWSETPIGPLFTALIIAAPVGILLVEVLPHGIAASRPESVVRWTLPIIYPLSRVLGPIARVSGGIASWLRQAPDDGQLAIEEGILSAAEEARREGVLDELDRAMIENIMELRDVQVGEVMTPRTDIFAIEVETDMREALRLVQRTSHSRIPVYSGNRDTIVGVLYVKDLLRQIDNEKIDTVTIRDVVRKPLFIPETKHVSDLLREFQSKKIHLAIVVDEYGGTSGVVTIEDILEEIVGEIEDEYDTAQFSPLKRISDTTVEVDAKVHIDMLNEQLGLGLPEDDQFETLGGFVFFHMGKVPKVGEQFRHEGIGFTILDADDRRINRLKLVIKR